MKALAVLLVALSAAFGWVFQADPYRLSTIGYPSDQAVLEHRDSPYSHITWVASASSNYLQLRFYDKVEGGVCLHPTWDEIIALAKNDPHLAHLVPSAEERQKARAKVPKNETWPHDWAPDPGTLTNTRYVCLYPAAVLLNQRLMDEAKEPGLAKPRILIVGLGSGIGVAIFAHHFPNASITVIDIDEQVIDMVEEHFPLLEWLLNKTTDEGSMRLTFAPPGDARQYIRYTAAKEAKSADGPYDVVVLDAYTAGSTIPPHLMTREFFAQCKAVMAPDGILMANIIGSYTGEKRLVLGGAIRSMRAAGFGDAYNIPISQSESAGSFDYNNTRNNIVLASAKALAPNANKAGWARLNAFKPYPELSAGTYLSKEFYLGERGGPWLTATVSEKLVGPDVMPRLQSAGENPPGKKYMSDRTSTDHELITLVQTRVRESAAKDKRPLPKGWDTHSSNLIVVCHQTDWVLHARENYATAIANAIDASAHSADALVGPVDGPARQGAVARWVIEDAPLFTDAKPNADILNTGR